MGRSPSFTSVLDTAWRLLRARGWLIFVVLFLFTLVSQALFLPFRSGWGPNLIAGLDTLTGPRPSTRDDGWIAFLVHAFAQSMIIQSAAIILFGWLKAISIMLCARIALDWHAGRRSRFQSLTQNFVPTVLIVWGVLIITTILQMIGMAFLIVPGVALSVVWYVAVFVAADEKVHPFAALRRSYTLTRGFRGPILAITCLFTLFGFAWGFLEVTLILPRILDSGFDATEWLTISRRVRMVLGWVTSTASGIVSISVYLVLKRAEAGPAAPEVDDVFA